MVTTGSVTATVRYGNHLPAAVSSRLDVAGAQWPAVLRTGRSSHVVRDERPGSGGLSSYSGSP